MFAGPRIKIARPLSPPRSARQAARKARIQSSRSEFEDQETLAKQKNDILQEIHALRKECESLQNQLIDKENDYDEQQSLEIEYLNITDDKNGSEYKRRVLVYSKRLKMLQSEMNELTDKYDFLSTYFSEDAIFRLKNEIVYEKHVIGQQVNELQAVFDVRDKAQQELESQDLKTGITMCERQKSDVIQLKKDLIEVQNKEAELTKEYQQTLRFPKIIEKQELKVKELEQRLLNFQHAKDTKQKDLTKKKDEQDVQRSVMENVSQLVSIQKSRDQERENFSSTMNSARGTRTIGRKEYEDPLKKKMRQSMTNSRRTNRENEPSESENDDFENDDNNEFENGFNSTAKSFGDDFESTGKKSFDDDFETTGKKSFDDDFETTGKKSDDEKRSDNEEEDEKHSDDDNQESENDKSNADEGDENKSENEEDQKDSDTDEME